MNKEQAIKKRAEWVAYCLEIGFIETDQIDRLFAVWDMFKDEYGNIRPESPQPSKPEQVGKEAIEFDFSFLHWIFDNSYSRYWGSDQPNNKKWYKGYTMPNRQYYTDQELYKLFNPKWAEQGKPIEQGCKDLDIERISEVINESQGLWMPCSGCHETVEGQEVGHNKYSEAFGCYMGSGCHECGGIGVIWDDCGYSTAEQEAPGDENR